MTQNVYPDNLPGMLSDLIAYHLVEVEGILDQPVSVAKKGIRYFRKKDGRYVSAARTKEALAATQVWQTSLIPSATWTAMLDELMPDQSVGGVKRTAVEQLGLYFLSNLLHLIPDKGAIYHKVVKSKTPGTWIREQGILNQPIHVQDGHVYFFDDNGTYTAAPVSANQRLDKLWNHPGLHTPTWRRLVPRFTEGMTLDAAMDMLAAEPTATADPFFNFKEVYTELIVKKLNDEGVAGQPIKLVHGVVSFFDEEGKLTSELEDVFGKDKANDLWHPKCIDHSVWDCALNFPIYNNLHSFVRNCLLEYIPNAEQLRLALQEQFPLDQYFIDRGIIGQTARILRRENVAFYFDENAIYRSRAIRPDDDKQLSQSQYLFRNMTHQWMRAAVKFQEGMTLSECMTLLITSPRPAWPGRKQKQDFQFLDRLITRVDKPYYERSPGNFKEETLDRIRVSAYLPRYMFDTWKELRAAVLQHRDEITELILSKIAIDPNFTRFDVPLDIFEPTSIVMVPDYSLEYIFEPKFAD